MTRLRHYFVILVAAQVTAELILAVLGVHYIPLASQRVRPRLSGRDEEEEPLRSPRRSRAQSVPVRAKTCSGSQAAQWVASCDQSP